MQHKKCKTCEYFHSDNFYIVKNGKKITPKGCCHPTRYKTTLKETTGCIHYKLKNKD